jgi:hypothetical protein
MIMREVLMVMREVMSGHQSSAQSESVRAIESPDVSEILDPGTIVITRVPSNIV